MLAEKHNRGNDIQETHTEHKHRDESQIFMKEETFALTSKE
jgi:hypothetical protein